MSSLHQDHLPVEGSEPVRGTGSTLTTARGTSRKPVEEKATSMVPAQRQGKQQRTGSTQTTTDIAAPASRPRRTVGGKVAAAAAGTIATRAKAATVKVASAKAATAKAATVRAVTGARSAAAAKAATRSAGARSVTAASASARPTAAAKPAVSKASKTTGCEPRRRMFSRRCEACGVEDHRRCGACGDEARRCHGDGSEAGRCAAGRCDARCREAGRCDARCRQCRGHGSGTADALQAHC